MLSINIKFIFQVASLMENCTEFLSKSFLKINKGQKKSEHGNVGLMAGLGDLSGLLQP